MIWTHWAILISDRQAITWKFVNTSQQNIRLHAVCVTVEINIMLLKSLLLLLKKIWNLDKHHESQFFKFKINSENIRWHFHREIFFSHFIQNVTKCFMFYGHFELNFKCLFILKMWRSLHVHISIHVPSSRLCHYY